MSDSVTFAHLTVGIRKPVTRYGLPSGRELELLGFHLVTARSANERMRDAAAREAARLYPGSKVVFADDPMTADGPAYLCFVELASDQVVEPSHLGGWGSSYLTLCGPVRDIGVGVLGLVAELLSRVDWDAVAVNDVLW